VLLFDAERLSPSRLNRMLAARKGSSTSSKDAPAATVNPSITITSPGKTGADPVPKSNCTVQSCYDRAMNYAKIITLEPGKRGGKPCIRGLRVTVYDVLENLASGMSHEDILREFPYLTDEDIRACLAYAADRERKLELQQA
jgi:uncharacterized protein (DUF433 family)